MKCSIFSIVCLIAGLGIGSVGGFYAGECVILKAQFAYQSGLMAGLAEETAGKRRR